MLRTGVITDGAGLPIGEACEALLRRCTNAVAGQDRSA